MSDKTFERILDSIGSIDPHPTVFFGGLGEPLFHTQTVEMVAEVKALGVEVDLITNGTLLDDKRSKGLIEAGLDALWVSIECFIHSTGPLPG